MALVRCSPHSGSVCRTLQIQSQKAMDVSTWVLVVGFGLLLVPIPPFATIAGLLTLATGGVMKLL